ncbi:N-acetylmuramoyl-L-alanine amidase [Breznakia pachnodae]|uniref:N-acetylmuramoyl-L-alanine amidase n=1 Tax=Breznakia pachnodae TaxID=265178 RepID=A0ABU0E7C0_9FIRM|nr:N-acetylmuramoyl-L-alanine amidase [Breznakia pachnodae]MDQ0362804.1 N-acetylmuramoyl-L-alanine amidase CwlA [Breznakia pachnodae]
MKKRFFLIALAMMFTLSSIGNFNAYATEDDPLENGELGDDAENLNNVQQDGGEDTGEINTEEVPVVDEPSQDESNDNADNDDLETGLDENDYVVDTHDHGEGFEDWYVGNPLLREFYGGYQRNGSFYIVRASDKKVFLATSLKVTWKNGGGVNKYYYVPALGDYLLVTDAYYCREYLTISEKFTLTRTAETYNHPFVASAFQRSDTLAPGTYTVTRVSLELIEVVKADGTKVWISPQYKPNDTFLSTNYGRFNGTKASLSVSNIRGIPIYQKIMPVREDKRTGIAMKPQYITIHNTGNSGYGANAAAHANGQINDSRTWISWHYTVDNKEIYQSVPMNEVAYHAGDGTNIGNSATIAIEICENSDGNYATAEKNAAYLTARLLYENNLPATAVRQHKDWSGKNCPSNMIAGTKGSLGWTSYMALVKTEYDKIVAENQATNEETGDTQISEELQAVLKANGYTFDGGYVYGFKDGTTLQSTLDKWKTTNSGISMTVTKDSTAVALTNLATTGQVAKITVGGKTAKVIFVVKGDVNGDGKVTSADYLFVKAQIMETKVLTASQKKAADVSNDSKVSSVDYLKIKAYIMGTISGF